MRMNGSLSHVKVAVGTEMGKMGLRWLGNKIGRIW